MVLLEAIHWRPRKESADSCHPPSGVVQKLLCFQLLRVLLAVSFMGPLEEMCVCFTDIGKIFF